MITVCASAACDFQLLQEALESVDSAVVIEVQGGVHPGPFLVPRDVTVRGTLGAMLVDGPSAFPDVPVVRIADGTTVTLEDLVVTGLDAAPVVAVGPGASLTVRGSVLADGFSVGGGACLDAEDADAIELLDSTLAGCWGATSGAHLAARDVQLRGVALVNGSSPALVVDGADSVVLDEVVVDGNGWGWAAGPAVDLVGVGAVDVSRAWFCWNLGGGVGALRIDGCEGGDCLVEHAVFQLNGGGGLVWASGEGVVRRSTFVWNTAFAGPAEVYVDGGSLALDHLVVVDAGAPGERPAFGRSNAGTLSVADSAIGAAVPGVDVTADGNAPTQAVFAVGWVGPACGLPVVLNPYDPGNAELVAWPDDAGRGAFTTADCGPWCADADGDGSPAMWDCAEDDPARSHATPEVVDDGIDQDCDRFDACWLDLDGDGWGGTTAPKVPGRECGPPLYAEVSGDCDDDDWTISPDAVERPVDATDADCDGTELCYLDADGDGFSGPAVGPSPDLACASAGVAPLDQGDCDDADPAVFPGAPDAANDGVDGDCADGDATELLAGGACGCGTSPGGVPVLGLALALRTARRRGR